MMIQVYLLTNACMRISCLNRKRISFSRLKIENESFSNTKEWSIYFYKPITICIIIRHSYTTGSGVKRLVLRANIEINLQCEYFTNLLLFLEIDVYLFRVAVKY